MLFLILLESYLYSCRPVAVFIMEIFYILTFPISTVFAFVEMFRERFGFIPGDSLLIV